MKHEGFGENEMSNGAAYSLPSESDVTNHVKTIASSESTYQGSIFSLDCSGLTANFFGKLPEQPPQDLKRNIQLSAKRFMDILLSLAILAFLAPLLLIVAAAIKINSSGPVLFKQEREGILGKTFSILKFRTMYVDDCDPSGVGQTTKADSRVTPVGNFLRRTSIDELPQLLNVVKGDMSIVGPRPHVGGQQAAGLAYRELVPYYDMRHMMRPGLTGWAQANGYRGPTIDRIRSKARIDHDIAYVQNFSLWLDIVIIFRTLKAEFITGNGY
ncbi:sugar transferase [Devosia nitrariae]|nr:sugar transferase [Devosia nitrariae]